MAINGYWWLLVAISGHWWLLVAISCYWWLLMAISDHCWLLVAIGGSIKFLGLQIWIRLGAGKRKNKKNSHLGPMRRELNQGRGPIRNPAQSSQN